MASEANANRTTQNAEAMSLPWNICKQRSDRVSNAPSGFLYRSGQYPVSGPSLDNSKPGEFVLKTLFSEFTVLAERKIDLVLSDPLEKQLSKSLQRGEDQIFDQLLTALGSVAEHCLPSLLRTLFAWFEHQVTAAADILEQKSMKSNSTDSQSKATAKNNALDLLERGEELYLLEKRILALEFIECLFLIEVLKKLPLHPGHEDLITHIESHAFKHFKFREDAQNDPNIQNINVIADLFAEVVGVLAQSRFQSVRKRFIAELKELRSKDPSPVTTHSIISLLMGMKFFRIKMVPIEEFEASFQFLHECAVYFLEVKDKDIKHALAGLFVEILVPVAATVKNEVNVPCLKNFVELLYSPTLDLSTKKKHMLALFPLVTCLLCVSQKTFFLQNWHCFLAMCLSNLKNRDPKMSRVALESLYRLLWVYMIRIKCESNSATQSRLHSIVNSLFPKGSKAIVPRETPLNIFVKIIQFIAQERLDFAMKEIVFDLLSVNRPIKIVITPERMSIGLRAFLVVADSLQQKEGEPPMPRTLGSLPSGNTVRVKKTFLNKMLTDEMARSIGMNHYYPYVRKSLNDMLRALDVQFGRPLMMTTVQNINKEPDDMITGERKPKIDLFRTCIAAIPRLIPDGMSRPDLIDLLSRLTVHMDEELRGLAFQSLQNIINDFKEWREDVIEGFLNFMLCEINDTLPQLLDNALRMLLQFISNWRSIRANAPVKNQNNETRLRSEHTTTVLHRVEAVAIVMLCHCRQPSRRLAAHILKEVSSILKLVPDTREEESVMEVLDRSTPAVIESCSHLIPSSEKSSLISSYGVDFQWLADRNGSAWFTPIDADNKNRNTMHVWSALLVGFASEVSRSCPTAAYLSWTLACQRLTALFLHLDPSPPTDNRPVLLRSTSSSIKKSADELAAYLALWTNYAMFACRSAPSSSAQAQKLLILHDLSSSPDSLAATERSNEIRSPLNRGMSVSSLLKHIVPLIRHEQIDLRSSAILGLVQINPVAIKDLMDELHPYIREAIDRKQENVRRRRKREMLRLQLGILLEAIADKGSFGHCSAVLDSGSLSNSFVEYIDGIRLYLESESVQREEVQTFIVDIKHRFSGFINKLVKNFKIEARPHLFTRELRRNLFYLFARWSNQFGSVVLSDGRSKVEDRRRDITDLELTSLESMSTVLSCGPVFEAQKLSEDSPVYEWLVSLLNSTDERISSIGNETIILLLENNPDVGSLLDWLVDCCYTKNVMVADACFTALAIIFGAREYPCDHYIAIINVALMHVGCPRAEIHHSALRFLQVLDTRFFDSHKVLEDEAPALLLDMEDESATVRLRQKHWSGSKRQQFKPLFDGRAASQVQLSKRMSELHPELTMPMFSEITDRFQTARPSVAKNLLEYLMPWLYNMELVDRHILPGTGWNTNEAVIGGKEGWGSVEATEMVLNNLFYMTVKFGDEYAKELEEIWAVLGSYWSNNMRVIIRYLFIVTGLSPLHLLNHSKHVVLFLMRAKPERLIDEMMAELQTVESLPFAVERTEAPPFYRVTSQRKSSGNSEEEEIQSVIEAPSASSTNLIINVEQGTLHTKRHSTESGVASDLRSKDDAKAMSAYAVSFEPGSLVMEEQIKFETKALTPHPHPLPMPEYGGFYAPLTEYLTETSATSPVIGSHRCNLALMLLCDIIVAAEVDMDWTPHVPLMLHISFLGLDHPRQLIQEHCKQLLLNLLLVVVSNPKDNLWVSRTLLHKQAEELGYHLNLAKNEEPPMVNLTEPKTKSESDSVSLKIINKKPANVEMNLMSRSLDRAHDILEEEEEDDMMQPQSVSSSMAADDEPRATAVDTFDATLKSLISFISSRKGVSLWNCEDITAKVWSVRSAEQLATFLEHLVLVFKQSLPGGHIVERWAEIALQLALSCSSRHYAGRSLQIVRALKVPLNSRMLSDILSRLVETVSEQGEDMQGYVTELMLTLEAAVDSLDSGRMFVSEAVRNLFNSTPNLNVGLRNRPAANSKWIPIGPSSLPMASNDELFNRHARSTSYSYSGCGAHMEQQRNRSSTESEVKLTQIRLSARGNDLGRSRSAHSLKEDNGLSPEDRNSILAQLFWIGVAMLETDYEHEFLLALRLLNKVLGSFPLEANEAQEKVEKIMLQSKWTAFPGLHAMLLKGCTSSATFEPTMMLLQRLTPLLELSVVDPSESANSFPFNVIALLAWMLSNYDDPEPLCIRAAESIAAWCTEKSKKLENLATVMTLYSRRSFSKESLQWTKCVVKYLYDAYSHIFPAILSFLVEVMDKGPSNITAPVTSIILCVLHYMDLNSSLTSLNSDLNKISLKYGVEGAQFKEVLKVLKLVVTRSSTLAAAPASTSTSASGPSSLTSVFSSIDCISIASSASILSETESKRELPGRTMEFTLDLTQTPIVGRRYLNKDQVSQDTISLSQTICEKKPQSAEQESSSPRRSLSYNHSFNDGWRKPWLSQLRTRDRLICLLTSFGQRVGIPKSPSVIFSQNSDIMEKQSSMASSTEEISATNNDGSAESKIEENVEQEFGLIKDFDFLEYELESQEGESIDNFNWGVRRRSLSNLGDTPDDLRAGSPSEDGIHSAAGGSTGSGGAESGSDVDAGKHQRDQDLSSDDDMDTQCPQRAAVSIGSVMLDDDEEDDDDEDEDGTRGAGTGSRSSTQSLLSDSELTLSNNSSDSPHSGSVECLHRSQQT